MFKVHFRIAIYGILVNGTLASANAWHQPHHYAYAIMTFCFRFVYHVEQTNYFGIKIKYQQEKLKNLKYR